MKQKYFKIINTNFSSLKGGFAQLGWVQWLVLLLFSVGSYGQNVGYHNVDASNSGCTCQLGNTSAVVWVTIDGTTYKYGLANDESGLWGGTCGHDSPDSLFQDVGSSTPYALPSDISELQMDGEILQTDTGYAQSDGGARSFQLVYKWYHESEDVPSTWSDYTINGTTSTGVCGSNKEWKVPSKAISLPLDASGIYYLKVGWYMSNSHTGGSGSADNYHDGLKDGYTARFSYNPETIWFKSDGGADFELSATGSNNYSLDNAVVTGGNGYFYNKLSDGTTTDQYWAGTTSFPSGTATAAGTLSGTKLGSSSGLYNIAFNSGTGVYTFTSVIGSSQEITSGRVTMDVYDALTTNTDTNWYKLNGAQSTLVCHEGGSDADFNPADDSFIHTLGINSTLKIGGEVRTNNDPNPVKMYYRVYLVGADPKPAFTTRELEFNYFLTSGTECGNNLGQYGTEYDLAASGGTAITLSTAGNYYVEVYFEAGGTMASGKGSWPDGGYSFTGDAGPGWGTDVVMGESSSDNFHYYNYTFTTDGLKFRTTGSYATSYGNSSNWPYSTSSDNTNIPVVAGTYNVTFDRTNQHYHFAPYSTTSTFFNNSDGSNYKALIKVVDVVDDTNEDTNDGGFGFTTSGGGSDDGCTTCSGLYESYMGLYILDADGALVADEIYNLDGAYGSANSSNLDLGAQFPGVTFRIGTEVKAWAKGKHKMCGCSSWYYVYEFDGTDPVEGDFPLPAAGSKVALLTDGSMNGKFTMMNTSEDLGTNTPMPLNPNNTSGRGSGNMHESTARDGGTSETYEDNLRGLSRKSYNNGDVASSLFFRGDYNSWAADSDSEFTNLTTYDGYAANDYMLYDVLVTNSGSNSNAKVANSSYSLEWGSAYTFPNSNANSSSPGNMSIPENNYTIFFNITTGYTEFSDTVLYRWKDYTNAAKTLSVLTPVNEVACPTCGGEYKVAVALLCWASDNGDCTDETSYYYHRDINQNKTHKGISLNPHHPNAVDKPDNGASDNTYPGTELFYVQKISIAAGGAANTYSGGTWDVTAAAYPQSYQDAYINEDITIAANDGFTCINLTVAAGVTVTLSENSYLEVLRAATTEEDGKIVVPKNANFIQRCDNQGHTANIVHAKRTRPVAGGDYVYLSSPIQENIIDSLSMAGFDYMWQWSNSVKTGKDWSAASTTVGKDGEGIIARNPFHPHTAETDSIQAFTIDFVGTATNGIIEVTVDNDDADITNNDNYALLGNPYACAVDGSAFITHANNSHLDGTLYYWTSNSRPQDGASNGGYGDYNKYDYNPADYASWNLSGATAASASAESVDGTAYGNNGTPTRYIPSGTSFFVQVTGSGDAYFNNSMRTYLKATASDPPVAKDYEVNDSTLFRGGRKTFVEEEKRTKSRLWINLNNGKGGFKQMLLAYVPGATDKRDRLFDSEVYSLSDALIYIPKEDGSRRAIDGRPFRAINDNETIPLGIESAEVDEYQIKIDHFDGDFENKELMLRDYELDSIHNLSKNPYVFTTNSGVYEERFELVIEDKVELVAEETLDETIQDDDALLSIASGTNGIIVSKPNDPIVKVEVYSILGVKIVEEQFDASTEVVVSNIKKLRQVVIVRVTFEDGHRQSRKIVY